MAEISLIIDSRQYGGWKSVSVELAVENLSGSFNLSLTDKWVGQANAVVIKPGDACTVRIDGQVVITGYVDIVNLALDAGNHTIQIVGRDKTADLIDCSVIVGTGQYKNLELSQIVTRICQPFGIDVSSEVDTGEIFKTFNIEQGSTAYECIQKLCNARQCLAISDGEGGVLITRAGSKTSDSSVIEGSNMLRGTVSYDNSLRFDQYIVKGQQQGSDELSVNSIAGNQARVTDNGVVRYRPLVIIADGQASAQDCADRASWERSTRKGRSRRFAVTVIGWTQENGSLWELNTLVFLNSTSLGVYDQLLIAGITYSLDDSNGQVTVLTLTPADAYLTFQTEPVDANLNPYLVGDAS